jgi:hypothetical protein
MTTAEMVPKSYPQLYYLSELFLSFPPISPFERLFKIVASHPYF